MYVLVEPASAAQKPVLRQMMELYLYDFSEYNGCDLSDFGLYDYPYLDSYWTEKERYPFFIQADGKLAGFVLVNHHCYVRKDGARTIAEFFILKKYRRQGVGGAAGF